MAADREVEGQTGARVTAARGWRSLIPFAAIIVVGGVLALVGHPPAVGGDSQVTFDDVPKQLGEWQYVNDIELTENEIKYLQPNATLYRTYARKDGRLMSALVVYRQKNRRDFFHTPEACYPAGGMKILNRETVTLKSAGAEIPAIRIKAEAQGTEFLTVYWFSSGRQLTASVGRQQWLMWLDRMTRNDQGWAFIRLITSESGDEESADALQEFAGLIAPDVQKAIREGNKQE
jgi:EpsI family protein